MSHVPEFLDDMATVLVAAGVASSSGEGLGWYLWKGHMPDSTYVADRGVVLVETAGFPSDPATGIAQPAFQMRIRGRSIMQLSTAYEEAEARADDAYRALHALTPQQIGRHQYVGIWAIQDPFFIGLDDSDRPVFSQNFRVQRGLAPTGQRLLETGDARLLETGSYLLLEQ